MESTNVTEDKNLINVGDSDLICTVKLVNRSNQKLVLVGNPEPSSGGWVTPPTTVDKGSSDTFIAQGTAGTWTGVTYTVTYQFGNHQNTKLTIYCNIPFSGQDMFTALISGTLAANYSVSPESFNPGHADQLTYTITISDSSS